MAQIFITPSGLADVQSDLHILRKLIGQVAIESVCRDGINSLPAEIGKLCAQMLVVEQSVQNMTDKKKD